MKLFKDTQLGSKLDYRDTVLNLNEHASVILAKWYTWEMKIMAILYEKTIVEVIADRKLHLSTNVQ